MIETFKRVNGADVPFKAVERRAGDAAQCWSDPSEAERELGWRAVLGIEEMVASAWRYVPC
jgi:UDP-glucose 4-epimerase